MTTLLVRLLENDGPTLRLLGANPFPDEPPTFVRARLYHYRFTTPGEVRAPVRLPSPAATGRTTGHGPPGQPSSSARTGTPTGGDAGQGAAGTAR